MLNFGEPSYRELPVISISIRENVNASRRLGHGMATGIPVDKAVEYHLLEEQSMRVDTVEHRRWHNRPHCHITLLYQDASLRTARF